MRSPILPEIMAFTDALQLQSELEWADAILLGPGLGNDSWAKQTFREVIAFQTQYKKPLVLDADGLNWLAQSNNTDLYCSVISPHFAEAARLLDCNIEDIKQDPYQQVRHLNQKYACFSLLKGAGSILDDGQDRWVFEGGNPGMASAGMGDLLSGILAACLLQYVDTAVGIRMAINLHNEAADRAALEVGEVSLIASDIISHLPALIKEKYK